MSRHLWGRAWRRGSDYLWTLGACKGLNVTVKMVVCVRLWVRFVGAFLRVRWYLGGQGGVDVRDVA